MAIDAVKGLMLTFQLMDPVPCLTTLTPFLPPPNTPWEIFISILNESQCVKKVHLVFINQNLEGTVKTHFFIFLLPSQFKITTLITSCV